ncbi:MAG: patatin-like phospholipase family protein [Anaerolineales bacterium]|nr:patatin-like phospholipase family protein [Anaerolineales bacterium]
MEITLALGGGGAKGNSHIGVLRRLEKEGYKIKSVAGTSFGGLVGILYAVGYSPAELQRIFELVDQTQLYGRDSEDGPALLGLSGARKWLDEVVGEKTFADLKIPCAVTAVNIHTGGEVILSEGRLKDAILATIAVPGIFPPHRLNGWELMDGGVLNPVPVSVARMLSPDLPIIAVVLSDPMDKPMRPYTIPVPSMIPRQIVERITRMNIAQSYDIFMRGVDISSRAVSHFRLMLDAPDVIVRPNVHDIDLLEKVSVADVAQLGEDALKEVLPQVKRVTSWGYRATKLLFGKK